MRMTRDEVSAWMQGIQDLASRIATAWSGGEVDELKRSMSKMREILNEAERIVKDDMWRNL